MTESVSMSGKLIAGSGQMFRLGQPSPPSISPEQCVEQGGHCHARTGMSRPSLPPQYEEKCKHCGHVRWAIPREAFEYREDA